MLAKEVEGDEFAEGAMWAEVAEGAELAEEAEGVWGG